MKQLGDALELAPRALNDAPMFAPMCRERTVSPKTSPWTAVMVWPGTSLVVTISMPSVCQRGCPGGRTLRSVFVPVSGLALKESVNLVGRQVNARLTQTLLVHLAQPAAIGIG